MKNVRINAYHQGKRSIVTGDMFGGIPQGSSPTKLLKADEIGMIFPKIEEQFGFRLEAIIGLL